MKVEYKSNEDHFTVSWEGKCDNQAFGQVLERVRREVASHHQKLFKQALSVLKPLYRGGYVNQDEVLRGIFGAPNRNKNRLVSRRKRLNSSLRKSENI